MIAAIPTVLTLVLWASVFGVAYSYVAYPLLLQIFSGLLSRRTPVRPTDLAPGLTVSVVLAAFNEEAMIAEKLASLVASDFPLQRLEILVGNDASSDGTARIVADFASRHPLVRLVNFAQRTGKPAIINALAARAAGDVLVLTDANIIFDPAALRRLAAWFADPAIGLVAANIVTRNLEGRGGIAVQEDAYIRREIQIKREQCIVSGIVIAPFGACFAIRRSDFRPVPVGYAVDDFFIAMQPLILGARAVQDMEVICREDPSELSSTEFRRKVRISRGNFQNLSAFRAVAMRPWSALGFHFVSHKVLRWMGPGFIFLICVACGGLALSLPFYRLLAVVIVAGLASPIFDRLFRRLRLRVKPVRFASYFLMMNVALGFGFILWALGRTGGVWKPSRSV